MKTFKIFYSLFVLFKKKYDTQRLKEWPEVIQRKGTNLKGEKLHMEFFKIII